MILSKDELIGCLQKEVHILLHLSGKVEAGMVDYRPTEKQRSTLELLQYLSMMGPELLKSIRDGAFDMEGWGKAEAAAKALDLQGVKAALAGQMELYAALVGGMSDEELVGEVSLFESKVSRARHIIDFVVCGHAAYRTQLFCYLKACGREELGTMNLWAGVDG